MAKDGTQRSGRRVRAGAKPEALNDKLEAGKPASRLIALAIIDARLATEAVVAISYAIGKADPLAVTVDSRGTSPTTSGNGRAC